MTTMAGSFRHFTAQPGAAPLLDAGIAAAVFAATLIAVHHGGGVPAAAVPLDATRIVLAACATLPVVAWRRRPMGVFSATATASILLAWSGSAGGFTPGPAAALFLLAASRTRQRSWTRRTSITVLGLFATYVAALVVAQRTVIGVELLHAALAWSVAWFAGDRSRLRREQISELSERAQRAERDAERERQLAVAEERARIARDLHDSAAHAISLIAVRAGAARLRHPQSPDRSVQALQAIEDLARQTVDDIDLIVGSLRDPDTAGHVESPPGLASLQTLVAQHNAAGMRVSLALRGDPGRLGRAVDQAVYRIAQESLTNAARHGAGNADIQLTLTGAGVDLTVTNSLRSAGVPRPAAQGHGLIGMRERAQLLGGTLETRDGNGTFRIRARIPYTGQRP
jgi:signal transduction histidine kinase